MLNFRPSVMTIRFVRFDVRKRLAAGVEVFPEIRRRVDALGTGEGLAVVAPFLPSPLIERLRGEGFASEIEHLPDGAWVARFWRPTGAGPHP